MDSSLSPDQILQILDPDNTGTIDLEQLVNAM